jgi:hypothetical protein
MEINSIVVLQDGKPTEAGVDLMRRVHEAMGFTSCYHEWEKVIEKLEDVFNIYVEWNCKYCDAVITNKDQRMIADTDPPYLTSLDAIHELELALSKSLLTDYLDTVARRDSYSILMEAHEKLEDIASIIDVECENVLVIDEDAPSCVKCNGTGKRKLLDVWEEQWS